MSSESDQTDFAKSIQFAKRELSIGKFKTHKTSFINKLEVGNLSGFKNDTGSKNPFNPKRNTTWNKQGIVTGSLTGFKDDTRGFYQD